MRGQLALAAFGPPVLVCLVGGVAPLAETLLVKRFLEIQLCLPALRWLGFANGIFRLENLFRFLHRGGAKKAVFSLVGITGCNR